MRRILLLFSPALLLGLLASPLHTEAAWPPESAYVDGVVGHAQQHNLSCEARSASDWAAFFGTDVSESEILAALPRSDNPNYGFVGNPDGVWGNIPPYSYGVHSNPIENVLGAYGLLVYGERNLTWEFLRSEIAAGRPVIVWVIGQMWPGEPVEYIDSQGRMAIVAHYEHTMILIGYDSSTVWAVDAYNGSTSAFSLSSFLDSWAVLQNMGVYYRINYDHYLFLPFVARGNPSTSTSREQSGEGHEYAPQVYTVQSGDTLRSVAEKYGLTWEALAELNGLAYPYAIYPEQELKLEP